MVTMGVGPRSCVIIAQDFQRRGLWLGAALQLNFFRSLYFAPLA